MKMNDREAMAQYCKAQAQINKLDKDADDTRRTLNERVRTYRSLLHDELTKQNLTCIEVAEDGKDPIYLRLKEQTSSPSIDAELIVDIFKTIVDSQLLGSVAEKHGHDLPKMLSSILTTQIRTSYTKKTDKSTLTISNTKERGFESKPVPSDVTQIATDLLKARAELSELRQTQKTAKQPIVEEQKLVEETVKDALKASDPKNMTTRVHMMQDGDEWVYYLRCKQKEVAPTIGIRRVVPIVESALVKTLHDSGMGREYSASFKIGAVFWNAFRSHLESTIDMKRQETKTTSRLTLDRGAPRRRRQA